MASNKSIASHALLFVAMGLILAASVWAQTPALTPAPAPSQSPCPPGFSNVIAFILGEAQYLARGISLIYSPVQVTPGTSTRRCLCYFSTNITLVPNFTIGFIQFPPIVQPNTNGPLACVPAAI
ncbi:hypothetical protein BAE44_0019229 [Dichanthelium oligosanthes]|uniref:Bifunctional inhibitor/plant lipid transfer protein/seed storage helical domain-containing protein n=1 Tax=Dichanthelium oligosanthes TaxID=888268 RepID=A0A1E5V3Q3_9POAL|nr:hypothetical protein BAE44_0019229 [Dichanthelium oligosanthes]